ncbi:MAG: 1-(5-phosphoribosyl)-5-[(5-phosphoribosylamino)methylideneamino]imidazole-4-carboxamide isomerase [Rhodospirillales bacterium]|nr:1-(5-phosphoribosyl)-5-[(5-phosphoribosylamino)methylideneamino]imidazole-4-carboxamide isomerase [Rhodospirillales bacterium]MSP79842.1 1-(5-phosphoribosyl)-5-[(5-phosphoribosylamino)methylideneamino]imidazole-4-carboxamide isomerase [Rhodospirillales bacterium]
MIFLPAIDLKDGRCVRLVQGHMASATVFADDAAAQARAFADAGAEWLHIVDLNGAFEGKPINGKVVQQILWAVRVPVQLGGGIRTMATVDFWLGHNVARIVLGTAALRDPALVSAACRRYPGQIAVGIDARDGRVATVGWGNVSDVTVHDLAKRYEGVGVAMLIHTDIERDGAMKGPNIEATVALAEAVSIPVILSGGVSSLDDLAAIRTASRAAKRPLAGVIAGRALYDGRLDVAGAVAALRD